MLILDTLVRVAWMTHSLHIPYLNELLQVGGRCEIRVTSLLGRSTEVISIRRQTSVYLATPLPYPTTHLLRPPVKQAARDIVGRTYRE